MRALLRFGRWIFASTLLTFAAMQSDRLIFGKLVTMSELGVYSIATIWATFPTQILAHVFQSAIFPTLSRLHDQKADLATAHAELRARWLMGCGWLTTCLISGGPLLIRLLYDQRAKEAGIIVQLLAAGTWFLALEITNWPALLALGRPKLGRSGQRGQARRDDAAHSARHVALWFPRCSSRLRRVGIFRYAVSAVGTLTSGLRVYKQDLFLTLAVAITSLLGIFTSEIARRLVAGPAELATRIGALIQGSVVFIAISVAWAVIFKVKPLASQEQPARFDVSRSRQGFESRS